MTFKIENISGEEPKLKKPGHRGTVAPTFYSLINFPDTEGVAGGREKGNPSLLLLTLQPKTKPFPHPGSGPALKRGEKLLACHGTR